MRYGTQLSQFLKGFLLTFVHVFMFHLNQRRFAAMYSQRASYWNTCVALYADKFSNIGHLQRQLTIY